MLTDRAGISMGLIDDIPTCKELCDRMSAEAEEIITGLANTVISPKAKL